jgi:hypothetical protein
MRLSATRLRATGGAISRGGTGFDIDATTYIAAVEAADGQALEAGVKTAINAFVVGCKADGIWTAIKASCILSGARTFSGALVPLAGTAPTNFNFVSGDYDRKTGLLGNGTTKSLRTGLLASALSNTSHHLFFNGSSFPVSVNGNFGGVYNGSNLSSLLDIVQALASTRETRSGTAGVGPGAAGIGSGFTTNGSVAGCRTSATELRLYQNGLSVASSSQSNTPSLPAIGFGVFARNDNGTQTVPVAARYNFFSIGDGLNTTSMLSLHNRVTALITAFGVAIP